MELKLSGGVFFFPEVCGEFSLLRCQLCHVSRQALSRKKGW